jgi:hypothetical protein
LKTDLLSSTANSQNFEEKSLNKLPNSELCDASNLEGNIFNSKNNTSVLEEQEPTYSHKTETRGNTAIDKRTADILGHTAVGTNLNEVYHECSDSLVERDYCKSPHL